MPIEIRKGEVKDFREIHSLIKDFATFIKTPAKVSITPEQMAKDQEFFNCLVAIDEDKIIGFATYFFAYYSWSGKAVYLDDLYVTDAYRGKGVGSQLFDKVLETGKAENCKKMRWQVSQWNKKAIDFYKDRGAKIDDVEINCDLEI